MVAQPAGPTDDYSNTFHRVRAQLKDSSGRSYVEFVRSLLPDYRRAWRDIALGYVMLVAGFVLGLAALQRDLAPAVVVAVVALWIGYWVAYLQLFIHEGAHFNLASQRDASDRLCNWTIAWMVGTSVKRYRVVHFQHHRALGTVDDTEITYFFPLNALFLIKSLFGIRALEVALLRRTYLDKVAQNKRQRTTTPAETGSDLAMLLTGACAHLAIAAVGWWLGGVGAGLAWILGIGIFFPFFGALRQLLEHRRPDADPRTDYTAQDHGAFTRMFGDGILAATFGGAGFNRHLLHHWEPQVSYTNLPQLEAFLLRTELAHIIEQRRTTYGSTFLGLLSLR